MLCLACKTADGQAAETTDVELNMIRLDSARLKVIRSKTKALHFLLRGGGATRVLVESMRGSKLTPNGVPAISRGLSKAIPPEPCAIRISTPTGVAASHNSAAAFCVRDRSARIPLCELLPPLRGGRADHRHSGGCRYAATTG